MLSRTALAAIALAVLSVPAAGVEPAQASHGGGDHGGLRAGGHCGTARWELKAARDDGRIEVEGEVDSDRAGQRWQWTLKHDGSVSARGHKSTTGRSGSFRVERRMTDLSGTDHFTFRATHGRTVCRGSISA